MKRDVGRDIIIQNSTRLARSLIAAGLVDELALTIAPVAVGKGRALFTGLPHPIELERAELKPAGDGTLVVRYAVRK